MWIGWVTFLSPFRFALISLMVNEFDGLVIYFDPLGVDVRGGACKRVEATQREGVVMGATGLTRCPCRIASRPFPSPAPRIPSSRPM